MYGPSIRNGWFVEISTNSYCCAERGVYDGVSVCNVGCQQSARASGEYVLVSENIGDDCYSRCFDLLDDINLGSSTAAPTGLVDGPAIIFNNPDYSASQTTDPVSNFIVKKTNANSKRGPPPAATSSLFGAYGLDSGDGYGVDTFCTHKGTFSGGACTDSCSTAVADGTYAIAGSHCYYDCYIPKGVCAQSKGDAGPFYSYTSVMDRFSCSTIVLSAYGFYYARFNGGPVFNGLTPVAFQPIASQQICNLQLSLGVPHVVVDTCQDCASVCSELDANQYTAFGITDYLDDCSKATCV